MSHSTPIRAESTRKTKHNAQNMVILMNTIAVRTEPTPVPFDPHYSTVKKALRRLRFAWFQMISNVLTQLLYGRTLLVVHAPPGTQHFIHVDGNGLGSICRDHGRPSKEQHEQGKEGGRGGGDCKWGITVGVRYPPGTVLPHKNCCVSPIVHTICLSGRDKVRFTHQNLLHLNFWLYDKLFLDTS